MDNRESIEQYNVVEITRVPEEYEGVIAMGDSGTVVEKYDTENFEIECVQSDGFTKWLATLNIRYLRLKSKYRNNR